MAHPVWCRGRSMDGLRDLGVHEIRMRSSFQAPAEDLTLRYCAPLCFLFRSLFFELVRRYSGNDSLPWRGIRKAVLRARVQAVAQMFTLPPGRAVVSVGMGTALTCTTPCSIPERANCQC